MNHEHRKAIGDLILIGAAVIAVLLLGDLQPMKAYQLFLLGWLCFSFAITLVNDFLPRKARPPYGVGGAIGTLIIYSVTVWVLMKCGAFSAI